MDANGTKFHLLLGRDDWNRCAVEGGTGVEWDEERAQVTLQPRLFQFVAAPRDTAPSIENRRGAARDRYGNWYWVDETKARVRVLSAGSRRSTDFWTPAMSGACACEPRFGEFHARDAAPEPEKMTFAGLAVTEDHYLVVGVVSEPAGLLVFDLHSTGEPRRLFWPSEVEFEPFDMAARPGGGVFILDRANRRYWVLDRHLNVLNPAEPPDVLSEPVEDDFQPLEGGEVRGSGRRTFGRPLPLDAASPLDLVDPVSIEALPDCTVLVLDRDETADYSLIHRYRFAERVGEPVSTDAMRARVETEALDDFRLVGYDIAFVAEHTQDSGETVGDRLYVASSGGNQTFAFSMSEQGAQISIQPLAEYLPMRLFGGKGLVAAGGGVFYDFADGWIPLAEQRRPRYVAEATLTTPVFDGAEPDCVWHRVMLDACIPPETSVEVWSRAANDARELAATAWRAEPRPYLRGDGTELPFAQGRAKDTRSTKADESDGTWEFLFQRARGRYVQLRLRVAGNERTSPRLRALRAYYPRFSYLANYLPAVYREEEQSSSFLDRFLANLEGIHTPLEDRIANAQALFDVRSAPTEALEWLAGWFGVALDPSWDERKRRAFIAHAMDVFRWRGTARGIRTALSLALEDCVDESVFEDPCACGCAHRAGAFGVRVVEKFLTRKLPAVVFGDPTELSGPREQTRESRWSPSQGRAALALRFSEFMKSGGSETAFYDYPLLRPSGEADANLWATFSRRVLGFVPSHADSRVTGLWQDFLARRYRTPSALRRAHESAWQDFSEVPAYRELPQDGEALRDWYQFESVVLAMRRSAHRFTVLLPMPRSATFTWEEHKRRLDLATRIVEMEKPAHTRFEVKFYWALFRLGEARLGFDSLVDLGSRAPTALPKMVLGRNHLGESYVAPAPPEDAADRFIPGRDTAGV